MNPIRIIGTGSPFGQDQFGIKIIDALEAGHFLDSFSPALISLHRCDRPGAALLELFSGAELVILIDALSIPDNKKHFIRWLDPRDLLLEPVLSSSHNFGISEALQLGRVLGELPRCLRILAIAMSGARDNCELDHSLYNAIEEALSEEINNMRQNDDLLSPRLMFQTPDN